MKKAVLILLLAVGCVTGKFVVDPSNFALASGESTVVLGADPGMGLGSCQRGLNKGYSSCQITKDSGMPSLFFVTGLASEWAVSDCDLGIYKTGVTSGAEVVTVDLSPLDSMIKSRGFCLMRIEIVERYRDKEDKTQVHEIPFAGGWFIEVLDDGYLSTPSDDVTAWCYKVRMTTSGRRSIKKCK